MKTPNYRDFCRDMMKLCKKHGVQIGAYDEGNVFLGPAKVESMLDFPFHAMTFTPTLARLEGGQVETLEMSCEEGAIIENSTLETAKEFVAHAPHLAWCQYLDGAAIYDESVRCNCGLLVFRSWFGC